MRLPPGKAWHGYVDGVRQIEVFRNPRKIQHAGSRYIMYRCSNHSSDGFTSWESAKRYADTLNPKLEWKIEPYAG